jgi:hypothetical protein
VRTITLPIPPTLGKLLLSRPLLDRLLQLLLLLLLTNILSTSIPIEVPDQALMMIIWTILSAIEDSYCVLALADGPLATPVTLVTLATLVKRLLTLLKTKIRLLST